MGEVKWDTICGSGLRREAGPSLGGVSSYVGSRDLIDSRSPRRRGEEKRTLERSKETQQGHICRNLHMKKIEMRT